MQLLLPLPLERVALFSYETPAIYNIYIYQK